MDQPIRKNFASDNVVSVSPAIMDALMRANSGAVPSYGSDSLSKSLDATFSGLFETEVVVFPVTTGTAANALALSALVPPYGAVLCDTNAHINNEEGGAPEFYTHGAKLLGLPSADGRMEPAALAARLALAAGHGLETSPISALSLTQATEWGTVYDAATLSALSDQAHAAGLSVHMDGARFANAVARLGCAPADITWRAGVDVLSFGATKNGAMAAEAVVFFNTDLARDFGRRIKRGGHLWSKHRFLAAQLEAYLADDLWLHNARAANAAAQRLCAGMVDAGAVLPFAVHANELFPVLPEAMIARLQGAGYVFYPWDTPAGVEGTMVRLVTSYDMTDADVDAFVAVARG